MSSTDLFSSPRPSKSTADPFRHVGPTLTADRGSDIVSMLLGTAPPQAGAAVVVTPDRVQRETLFRGLSPRPGQENAVLEPKSKGGSQFTISSPPSLLPRPVKTGNRSLGLPPSIPLIPNTDAANVPSQESGPPPSKDAGASYSPQPRLNKFVRRLHDMLQAEKNSGIVEWRRGLLVLYSTDDFAKKILPTYFNTRNFKTFRRQLNYYGFVHVRSFSTTGASTTALWVNRALAKEATDDIASVLKLRRVEPCETTKTAEGRRHRKELAICTVEEDIGVSAKSLQLEQIRTMALRESDSSTPVVAGAQDQQLDANNREQGFRSPALLYSQHKFSLPPIPNEVHIKFPTDASSSYSHSSTTSSHHHRHHQLHTISTSADDSSSEQDVHTTESDDTASTSAANVLLMLSRA